MRQAEFLPITPEMIPEILAQYRESLLKPETLQAFLQGRMEAVHAAMREGQFIYDPDERPEGGLSIRETLERGLAAPPGQPRTVGYCLRSKKTGRIDAWQFWEEIPDDRMLQMLRDGVTGGGLQYSGWLNFAETLQAERGAVQDRGSVRSKKPFAAKRLGAKCIRLMREEKPQRKFVVAYFMRGFKVRKQPPPQQEASGRRRRRDAPVVQPPPRVVRFVQRVARLRPGKYVLTLTLTEDRAFWTIQEMGQVEK